MKQYRQRFKFDIPFWNVSSFRDSIRLIEGEIDLGMKKGLTFLEFKEQNKILFTTFVLFLIYEDTTKAEKFLKTIKSLLE